MVIISFAKSKITAFQVETEKEIPKTKALLEMGEESLVAFLGKVKETFGEEKVRILLPEEELALYYWSTDKTNLDKDLVLQIAKKEGIFLEDDYFAFKETAAFDKRLFFQVLKAQRSSLEPFLQELVLTGLRPQVMETPSFALARLTRFEKKPLLINYRLSKNENLLLAVFSGQVLSKTIIKKSQSLDSKIKEFKRKVEDDWHLKLEEKEDLNLNIVEGLASRGQLEEKGNFLNLKVPLIEVTSTEESSPQLLDADSGKKISLLSLLALSLASGFLVALVGGGIVVYQNALKKLELVKTPTAVTQQPQIQDTKETSEAAIVTDSTSLMREEIRLKVLNGAGVAGTASGAKDFLTDLGYKQIEIDNADGFDYQETEIFVKDSNKELFDLLKNDLAGQYQVKDEIFTLQEEEIESLDVLIIVGKLTVQ